MISAYIKKIEGAISSASFIISSDLQKYYSSTSSAAYIRGRVVFSDMSFLEFSEFLLHKTNKVIVDKYRYQYMDSSKRFVFRYDNAPHHKEIPTFPSHKHAGDVVIESKTPIFVDVLAEIASSIVTSSTKNR